MPIAVRVVLAEDSFLVREGLQQLLESSPTVDVVATCGDMDELFEAIDREHPDVVLTDIRMPPTRTDEGIRVASRLRETHPDTGVIILSQYLRARVRAGAAGPGLGRARLPAQGAGA